MTKRQIIAAQELLEAADNFARAFPDDPAIMIALRRMTKGLTEWMCYDGEDGRDTPN